MDVKLSDNLFLCVAELNKLKQSLGEKGWKMFAKNLVSQFGIAKNGSNSMFLPIPKSGVNEVITIQPGVAFDSDMNIIVLNDAIDVNVPAAQLTGNLKYWLILRYSTTNNEQGTVNISADGALTGTGTDFLNVLRGQPNFPTKVRLASSVNTGDYEVVRVASATSAILSGTFTAESNLKYSVIGTFTPGFIPSSDNALIYEYDSYEFELRISEEMPTLNDGNEFIICCVDYVNTAMQLQDYRINYMLNNPFVQTTKSIKELSKDNIVTLMMSSIVSLNERGILMELQLEHGFKVTSFETNILSSGYAIDILSGGCNFISLPSQISLPNFRGWYFLNKTNMAYSVITDSSNTRLFIEDLNPDSITGTDIVLIPPFKEIEYQITVGNNVPSPGVPYVFKFDIENTINKCLIPILWPTDGESFSDSVVVSMKYRMIGSNADKYPLYDFATAGYTDHAGVMMTTSNSRFTVPIASIQPDEKQRNYS